MMVNTFLPFADFQQTASCLEYRRLGKQRVEARQIIKVLEDPGAKGWKNHPAVIMWKGYTIALKKYFNVIVLEWIKRGYKNTLELYNIPDQVAMPWWMGNTDFHYSHQASLLRKDSVFYRGKFPDLPTKYKSLGYIWPKLHNGKGLLEFSPVKHTIKRGSIPTPSWVKIVFTPKAKD
jgi:hypothetical protein